MRHVKFQQGIIRRLVPARYSDRFGSKCQKKTFLPYPAAYIAL